MNFHRRQLRGFTLMEMIIVLVIFVMLASFLVPRIGDNSRRELQVASEKVADMLTVFAQRERLGQRPVSLSYDSGLGELALMILDMDETDPEAPPSWRADRTAPPFLLPASAYVSSAVIDGRIATSDDWTVTQTPGQARQSIEVTLSSKSESRTIALAPGELSPRILGEPGGAGIVRSSVDLDAAGRNREDW